MTAFTNHTIDTAFRNGYGRCQAVPVWISVVRKERRVVLFPLHIMEEPQEAAHGRDVFNSYWDCACEKCGPRRKAINRLVDSFAQVPSRWISLLSEYPELGGERLPLPMWGTLFLPTNNLDFDNIAKLLRDFEPEGDEQKVLAYAGWKEVGNTGIYGIEFDEELILGIHGAGYDFYTAHWSKLYDALGYHWHK